jgi:hypothetical protein
MGILNQKIILTVSDKELFVAVHGNHFALIVELLRFLVVEEQLGRSRTVQPGLDKRSEFFILDSLFLYREIT